MPTAAPSSRASADHAGPLPQKSGSFAERYIGSPSPCGDDGPRRRGCEVEDTLGVPAQHLPTRFGIEVRERVDRVLTRVREAAVGVRIVGLDHDVVDREL